MSSTSASPTQTGLFPTPTQSSNPSQRTGTNVYYLVFLGVLVVLLLLAACLAYRAFRLRRRYRTATQLAIARGEMLPPDIRRDYWGLGGLSAWTSDGVDRLGMPLNDDIRSRGPKGKWQRIPKLWDAVVEDDSDVEDELASGKNADVWYDALPISLLSLRTEEETPAEPMQADSQGTPASYRLSLGGLGGFGRNQRQRNLPEEASSTAPPPPVLGEIDRPLNQDEPLSVGVIIRMPLDPEWYKELQRTDSGLDDGDEEPGWRPGMELGVWSGVTT